MKRQPGNQGVYPKNKKIMRVLIGLSLMGASLSSFCFIAIKMISLQTFGVISNSKILFGFILGIVYLQEPVYLTKVVVSFSGFFYCVSGMIFA